MFSSRFTLHHHPTRPHPPIYAAYTTCEDNPKRITKENIRILAEMRGFIVNKGPPRDYNLKEQKVKIGIFRYILAKCFTFGENKNAIG